MKMEEKLLKKDIEYLFNAIDKGFKQVHLRQDVTNGKLMKHELQLNQLENSDSKFLTREDYFSKKIEKSSKWQWLMIGMMTSIITSLTVALMMYLLRGLN